MTDTFLGLESARSGLEAAQNALDTVSHNIANANTEGFHRQRVELVSSDPISFPTKGGRSFFGTGVSIEGISRVRDAFLEASLRDERAKQGKMDARSEVLGRIESLFNEPGEAGISNRLEQFFNAWEELADNPESSSVRSSLREKTTNLIDGIRSIEQGLDRELDNINRQLNLKIQEVNNKAGKLADLNEKLARVEGRGSDANDIRDRIDRLTKELSNLVNIETQREDNGTVTVRIGSYTLVERGATNNIRLDNNLDNPRRRRIEFETNTPLSLREGELKGLIDVRDEIMPELRSKVNKFTSSLVNEVNRLHEQQFGLDGKTNRPFFKQIKTGEVRSAVSLPSDTDLNTTLDQLDISSGDFFVGDQRLVIEESEVKSGTAITLGDLLNRITESRADVRAEFEPAPAGGGSPAILIRQYNPPTADTRIDLKRGTSDVLDELGLEPDSERRTATGAEFSDAMQDLELSEPVKDSLDAIAAAKPAQDGSFSGPGDNRGALEIAGLKSKRRTVGEDDFFEFYNETVSELGVQKQDADRNVDSQEEVVKQVQNRIETVSGVDIDEEATRMIKFQKTFQASSRVITTIDEMLDTIVNRMGVVGR